MQFGTTKHEQIFSKTDKIEQGRRESVICGQNLQVLIYSILHEKNRVITY